MAVNTILLTSAGIAGVILAGSYLVKTVAKAKNPVATAAESLESFAPGINAALPNIGYGVGQAGVGVAGLGMGVGAGVAGLGQGLNSVGGGIGDIGSGLGSSIGAPGYAVSGFTDTYASIMNAKSARTDSQLQAKIAADALEQATRLACWKQNHGKSAFVKFLKCGSING